MAGDFKHYDAQFSHLKGTCLDILRNRGLDVDRDSINKITCWDEKSLGSYVQPPQHKVHYAVYGAGTAVEWQKWRVSLKGLSTKEKIFCLQHIWRESRHLESAERELQQIRIHNYLGALIRGGQLSSDLRIQH